MLGPPPSSWAVYHKACLAECPARLPQGVEEGWLFLDEGDLRTWVTVTWAKTEFSLFRLSPCFLPAPVNSWGASVRAQVSACGSSETGWGCPALAPL